MPAKKRSSKQPAPYKDIDQELGDTFKKLRLALNKTQDDIAAPLGISTQQYQKNEAGVTKWTLERLYTLADYFNKDARELLPPPQSARGFEETTDDFIGAGSDAAAISEIVAMFSRIQSKSTRRKIIELLNELVEG